MKTIKSALCYLFGLYCLYIPTTQSETITIGKGTGVVWEGMPFNATLDSPTYSSFLYPAYALLVISDNYYCMRTDRFTKISGYSTLKIAEGVGLIPRATGVGNFTLNDGQPGQLTGTLGLPETAGVGPNNEPTIPNSSYDWCLNPASKNSDKFYDPDAPRVVNIAGSWVMVADGTQSTSEILLSPMYASTLSGNSAGNVYQSILPTNITLRISTLECNVDTVTAINFGAVMSNTQQNSELAATTVPLNVTCGQPTDQIDANINVQFRAISGLYNNAPAQLSLDQGGGYITGEIDNNVTGSGACGLNSGITFDNQQIKIGSITTADTTKTLNNNVTWRLCSGGNNLPIGDVTSSAEMLVTFN